MTPQKALCQKRECYVPCNTEKLNHNQVINIFVVYINDINPSIKVPDKGPSQIPLIAPENKMLDGL